MLDIHSLVGQLKRPGLLVRAARHGVDAYYRDRDLLRTLKAEELPRPAEALMKLMDIESELNEQRKEKDANYSIAHHIDALTAIMSEARLLKAMSKPELVT